MTNLIGNIGNWKAWLAGMWRALITGATGAIIAAVVKPEAFNFADQLKPLIELAAGCGVYRLIEFLHDHPLPDDNQPTVSPTVKLSLILLPFLMFMGCATTPDGKIDAGQTAVNATQVILPVLEPASELACKVLVIQKATDDADRIEKAKYLYTVASCVRTLMGGVTPTPDQIENAIWAWTPDKVHWADLASGLSGLWEKYYAQLDSDPKLVMEALEQIAEGAENAAKPYIQ